MASLLLLACHIWYFVAFFSAYKKSGIYIMCGICHTTASLRYCATLLSLPLHGSIYANKKDHSRDLLYLVGPGGFEPPTSTTSMWRSSQMS